MALDWNDGIDRRMADWLQEHGWPTDVEAHCRTCAKPIKRWLSECLECEQERRKKERASPSP